MKDSPLVRYLWPLVKVLLFVSAIWYIVRWADISQIKEVFFQSSWIFLLIAFLCVLLTQVFKSGRFLYILRMHGLEVPFPKMLSIQSIVNFWSRVTPGKVGDMGKFGFFGKKRLLFPYILLEKFVDVIVIVLLAIPAIYIVSESYRPYIVMLAVVGIILLSIERLRRWVRDQLKRVMTFPKSKSLTKITLGLFCYTIVGWIFSLLALYFTGLAAGYVLNPILFISAAASAVAFGVVSGVPGGYGTREAALAYLLHVLTGARIAEATTIAIYAIIVVTLSEFILFLVGSALEKKPAKPKNLNAWKKEELKLHDAKLADAYDRQRESIPHGKFYQDYWMAEMLKDSPKRATFLDYCCGTSILFPHIKKMYPGASYVGVDLSPEMLSVGKKRYSKKKGFRVMKRDGENLRLKEKFDVVIARGAIHHLPRPGKGLDEIRKVLKKKGMLIISEPAANPVIKLARWIMYKTNSHFSSRHRSFTYGEMRRILREADYELVSVRRFGFFAYPFGFPDILPLYKVLPYTLMRPLTRLDNALGKIPLIKSLSWSVIIVARPKKS